MILSERAIHFMVVIPGFWSLGHRFRSAARPSLRAALRDFLDKAAAAAVGAEGRGPWKLSRIRRRRRGPDPPGGILSDAHRLREHGQAERRVTERHGLTGSACASISLLCGNPAAHPARAGSEHPGE